MPRKLIVHIGLHKTGSTSIQRMLFELRNVLQRRGIRIPSAGCPPRLCCHNNIAHALSGAAAYQPHLGGWAVFRAEIANSTAPTTLVSAEEFSAPRQCGIIDRLAELAESENLQTTILTYVRPQHEWLESKYSEYVTSGGTATFDAYVEKMRSGPHLDFNAILGPWRDAFGSRVAVCPSEAFRLPQGLLSHFLGVLGIGTNGASLDDLLPRQRVRGGAKELAVRRLVNTGMPELEFREQRVRSSRLKFLPVLLRADPPFVGLNDTQIREITDAYAEPNARFARDFGIDDDGLLFRDPIRDRLSEPNVAEWYQLSPRERRTVCRYVNGVAGIDLTRVDAGEATISVPPNPLPSMSTLKKWWLRPRVARQRIEWTIDPFRWRVLGQRARRHLDLGPSQPSSRT